jgi:hypothetical protein
MSNKAIILTGAVFTLTMTAVLFWPKAETTESNYADDGRTEVVMYKNPGCECCTKWAAHMDSSNFRVQERAVSDLYERKESYGITQELSSCHTAIVGGYVVEGHVPSEDVERLLKEKPDAIGLTVPGMPIGSPGMEVPGRAADSYEVLLIAKDGSTSVFSSR